MTLDNEERHTNSMIAPTNTGSYSIKSAAMSISNSTPKNTVSNVSNVGLRDKLLVGSGRGGGGGEEEGGVGGRGDGGPGLGIERSSESRINILEKLEDDELVAIMNDDKDKDKASKTDNLTFVSAELAGITKL